MIEILKQIQAIPTVKLAAFDDTKLYVLCVLSADKRDSVDDQLYPHEFFEQAMDIVIPLYESGVIENFEVIFRRYT